MIYSRVIIFTCPRSLFDILWIVTIAIDAHGQHVELVTSFVCLGRSITEDGKSEKETKRRIMIARATFINMGTIIQYYRVETRVET